MAQSISSLDIPKLSFSTSKLPISFMFVSVETTVVQRSFQPLWFHHWKQIYHMMLQQMQPCASPAAKPFASLVVFCVARSVSPQKYYVKF